MSLEYNSLDDACKVVLIGNSGVGKTAIVERYTKNIFPDEFFSTVGIDFAIKMVTDGSYTKKLHIWDTAGQDRFHSIILTYFRNMHAAIIVYSVKDAISFAKVAFWYEKVKMYNDESICIFIVGNMCECSPTEREVSYKTGETYAKSIGAQFIEVSAKNGNNVNLLFQSIVSRLQPKEETILPVINLIKNDISRDACKCCF